MTPQPDRPFASGRAEARIRLVSITITVVAVVLLLVGLYLLFFSGSALLGTVLALVAVVDLTLVPFVTRSMRSSAIAQEHGPQDH